jgi:WD40 repeat protein
MRRDLERDAIEWDRSGRNSAYLWRGDRLAAARSFMAQGSWPAADVRNSFLEAASGEDRTTRERESRLLALRATADYEAEPELGILLALSAIEEYAATPEAMLALDTALRHSRLRGVLRHLDIVTNARFSPDGSRIVTVSEGRTARVWDTGDGAELVVLRGQRFFRIGAMGISSSNVALSPDGSRIVTASIDRTARVWDTGSGAELAVLRSQGASVTSAAFSPDGSRIVTASDDQTTRVWDTASPDYARSLKNESPRAW